MVLEIFTTALAEGVGTKAQENTDKKRLKEAEGDPEEYQPPIVKIGNDNPKFIKFLKNLMIPILFFSFFGLLSEVLN